MFYVFCFFLFFVFFCFLFFVITGLRYYGILFSFSLSSSSSFSFSFSSSFSSSYKNKECLFVAGEENDFGKVVLRNAKTV